MSSYTERLEAYFWGSALDEKRNNDILSLNRLVQLMSLDEHEIEEELKDEQQIRTLIGFEETIKVVNEEWTTEDSDSDLEPTNVRMNKSEDKPESSFKPKQEEFRERKRRSPENNSWLPRDEPRIKNDEEVRGISTLNIDCRNNLTKREEILDKWAKEMNLIITTNPEKYDSAQKV